MYSKSAIHTSIKFKFMYSINAIHELLVIFLFYNNGLSVFFDWGLV